MCNIEICANYSKLVIDDTKRASAIVEQNSNTTIGLSIGKFDDNGLVDIEYYVDYKNKEFANTCVGITVNNSTSTIISCNNVEYGSKICLCCICEDEASLFINCSAYNLLAVTNGYSGFEFCLGSMIPTFQSVLSNTIRLASNGVDNNNNGFGAYGSSVNKFDKKLGGNNYDVDDDTSNNSNRNNIQEKAEEVKMGFVVVNNMLENKKIVFGNNSNKDTANISTNSDEEYSDPIKERVL